MKRTTIPKVRLSAADSPDMIGPTSPPVPVTTRKRKHVAVQDRPQATSRIQKSSPKSSVFRQDQSVRSTPLQLRADVVLALREAKLSPHSDNLFEDVGRAAIRLDLAAKYVEGVATRDGMRVPHAWIQTADGVDHDLITPGTTLQPLLVMSPGEVMLRVMRSGDWGPFLSAEAFEQALRAPAER